MKLVFDWNIKLMSTENPKMTSEIQMTRNLNNNTNTSFFFSLVILCFLISPVDCMQLPECVKL